MSKDFIQIKDLKPGMTILHRGRRITVRQLLPVPDTELLYIIDTDGRRWGPFHRNEFIGLATLEPRREAGRGPAMKHVISVRLGNRVFSTGVSFRVSEVHLDEDGILHFMDAQGFLRGPYLPLDMVGVIEKPPVEKRRKPKT